MPQSLQAIADIGNRDNLDMRPVLLRVVVDLFVSKPHHHVEEIRQFEEIAGHLIDAVDSATRATVAAKLFDHALTPAALLDRLAAHGGRAAFTIFAKNRRMSRSQLESAVAWGRDSLAEAVATRPDLDDGLIRALAERPETAVLGALVANPAIHLPPDVLDYLVRRARRHEELARELCGGPFDLAALLPLLPFAGREKRMDMILHLCTQDLLGRLRPPDLTIADDVRHNAMQALVAGDRDGFWLALSRGLHCDRREFAAIDADADGESLVLLLRATGFRPDAVTRVLLCWSPQISQSVERVHVLSKLAEDLPQRVVMTATAAMIGRRSFIPLRSGHVPAADQNAAESAARSLLQGAQPATRTSGAVTAFRRTVR